MCKYSISNCSLEPINFEKNGLKPINIWWRIDWNSFESICLKHTQPLNFTYLRLLNRCYEKKVTLTGQIQSLKCSQPLEPFTHFKKSFRSFNSKNFGSVGQRALKLPIVKLWEWFNPGWTERAWTHCGRLFLMNSNFDS